MNIFKFVMILVALALLTWLNAEARALRAQRKADREKIREAAPHLPAHTH